MLWSVAKSGETATPSAPASPRGVASSSWPMVLTVPCASMVRTRVVSRSVTMAVPSGRKSMPQGTSRPCATVPMTLGRLMSSLSVSAGSGVAVTAMLGSATGGFSGWASLVHAASGISSATAMAILGRITGPVSQPTGKSVASDGYGWGAGTSGADAGDHNTPHRQQLDRAENLAEDQCGRERSSGRLDAHQDPEQAGVEGA